MMESCIFFYSKIVQGSLFSALTLDCRNRPLLSNAISAGVHPHPTLSLPPSLPFPPPAVSALSASSRKLCGPIRHQASVALLADTMATPSVVVDLEINGCHTLVPHRPK